VYGTATWVAPTWTATVGHGELRVYGEGIVHDIDMAIFGIHHAWWGIESHERSYGLNLPRVWVARQARRDGDVQRLENEPAVAHGWAPACEWSVHLPFWLLLTLCLAPTAYLWWRRSRRIPPGHCKTCGYNLTGNVSGRCPECGSAVGHEAGTEEQNATHA